MSTPDFDDPRPDREDADGDSGRSGAGTTRRRLLVSGAATWATVSLAGCPSGNGGTDTTTTTATGGDGTTTTTTATPEPQPENYVVTAETGTGSEGVPESAGFVSACSPTRRFVPGMQAIFYVGIWDPETGDQLTDEDLSSVVVNIDGGPQVELGWAGDDEENPAEEWGGSWVIPDDMEPGTVSYTVEVTDGDANFRSVGILENSMEVIEYSDPTNYVVTTDTYYDAHAPEYTNGWVGSCAPERQFGQDMNVTFVVGIFDGASGEPVTDEAVDSVNVQFPDTDVFDDLSLSYVAPEEEGDTPQWSGTIETPSDVPTGTYTYTVTVTDGDANFYNVGIASSQFTIIEVQAQG